MIKPILILLPFAIALRAEETSLKPDEQIIFYPSIAQRVKGETNLWQAPIRGNVFEPEKRSLMVGAFRKATELKTEQLSTAESSVFDARARLFLVDHERGKRVFIRLGTNEFFVGKSGADGHFSAEITFSASTDATFTAALKSNDRREFKGRIFPLEAEGVSIISDIDDTIKITEVRDKQATLQNTFLREFQPVPGMAEFYQALAQSLFSRPAATLSPASSGGEGRERGRFDNFSNSSANVTFHYISASPWQLYEPLAEFVRSNHFPAGTFELKQFRWKDSSFFSLFANPEKYKPGVIEPLLKRFPKRKFMLIGDSGERDPEIYAALARKYPKQITSIYIRDVTNEAADSPRYQKVFRDMPRSQWRIFREPAELLLPSMPPARPSQQDE